MSTKRQLIFAGIGAALVTVLFFVFALKPKLTEIAEVRADVESAVDRESSLRAELGRLTQLQKSEPQTRAKLATLKGFLPSVPDLPGFIRQAQTAANKAGVDLKSIAPSPPADIESANGVQSLNATLTVSGGFHRIEELLSRLEGLQRVVEVRTLSLSPVADPISGGVILDGTITLVMYVVSDDATAPTRTTSSPRPTTTARVTP